MGAQEALHEHNTAHPGDEPAVRRPRLLTVEGPSPLPFGQAGPSSLGSDGIEHERAGLELGCERLEHRHAVLGHCGCDCLEAGPD